MPFEEIYAVNFAEGNLHPHLNKYYWPDMLLMPTPPFDLFLGSKWTFDSEGRTGIATRGPDVDENTPAAFSRVYVAPPAGSVSINSRLLARVTFDKPLAEGFAADKSLHPISSPGPLESTGREEVFDPTVSDLPLSIPELWTVVVSFGPDRNFQDTGVHVTCQFNRRGSTGVRLNTPGGLQQGDQADQLESPLNYPSLHGGVQTVSHLLTPPPLFTLSHSFCGVKANEKVDGEPVNNTPGVGTLEIARDWIPSSVSDHRVYSSRALIEPAPNTVTSIGALGVTIFLEKPNPGVRGGIGRVSARLRTFSVFENKPLS